MLIYKNIILSQLMKMFSLIFVVLMFLMFFLIALDQMFVMPESVPWKYLLWFLLYETVNILCWVLPLSLYISLVWWTVDAIKSQFIYRIFHAGMSKFSIYKMQFLFIFPICALSFILNFLYLPLARSYQRSLLEYVYENDILSQITFNRFYKLNLADEAWVLYLQKQSDNFKFYAFMLKNDKFSVMCADDLQTMDKKLILTNGYRFDIWPLARWEFESYGLSIPDIKAIDSNSEPDYKINIFKKNNMFYGLELYNRVNKFFMCIILSIIPVLFIYDLHTKSKSKYFLRALSFYIIYWIVFIICRFILLVDNFEHLDLVLLPHGIMAIILIIYGALV